MLTVAPNTESYRVSRRWSLPAGQPSSRPSSRRTRQPRPVPPTVFGDVDRVTRPGYGRDVDTGSEHRMGRGRPPSGWRPPLLAANRCRSWPVRSSSAPARLLHAQLDANGWRFHAVDVVVEQRRLLAYGWAAHVRHRCSGELDREQAGAWRRPSDSQRRSGGRSGRCRCSPPTSGCSSFHEGEWASVWYSAIRQIVPSVDDCRLELIFEDDPPYLLAGEWVPYLTVIITAVLAEPLRSRRGGLDSPDGLSPIGPDRSSEATTEADADLSNRGVHVEAELLRPVRRVQERIVQVAGGSDEVHRVTLLRVEQGSEPLRCRSVRRRLGRTRSRGVREAGTARGRWPGRGRRR